MADYSPLDLKMKKLGSRSRPSDVGTIGTTGHRSPRCPPSQRQFLETPYQMIQQDQYRPATPYSSINSIEHRFHRVRLAVYTTRDAFELSISEIVGSQAIQIEQMRFPDRQQYCRPFAGTDAKEDVQREDDEILRQLRTTQAAYPFGASWPYDDLPPEGSDHVRLLFIDVACSGVGYRLSCWTTARPERMSIGYCHCFGIFTIQFWAIYADVRAYDRTQRTVMGLRIQTSFNLLLIAPGFMRWVLYHFPSLEVQQHSGTQYDERHVLYSWLGIGSPLVGGASLLSYLIMTYHMDWVTLLLRMMHDTWRLHRDRHVPRTEGVDRVPEAVEIQGQMRLSSETTMPPEAMIVASPSPDRASVFSMCFPEEILDYDCLWIWEMVSMFDGDGLVATDITHDTVSIEGASNSVDPPLSLTLCPSLSPALMTFLWKVTPISGSIELIDFGAPDQPRELRIGSFLSLDERVD
ncbi:hypothetical protein CK203_048033 [Vitis vinifera]|uniref:Uncharacterized protein n=1 Tax=Vitis vinifera TaxID=29760 RepID=A0A438GYW9_VITVI|nr:hypothetical protein CK203_048033 [Vitis vinifera]